MNMLRVTLLAVAIAGLLPAASQAGVYTDELSKCLVSSTTAQDKTDLVRWMFVAMALHPEVSSIASVTAEQRTEMSRTVGQLFERLLTESCRAQYRDAVSYEGQQAIFMSFQVLGQVAARSLFEDQAVAKYIAELGTYVSDEKLKAAAKPDPQ